MLLTNSPVVKIETRSLPLPVLTQKIRDSGTDRMPAATSQYNYDEALLTQVQTPPPQGFTQGTHHDLWV